MIGAALLLAILASGPALAEDAKVAGTDVPVPKRVKTVQPEYPPEALAQGLRGIVILELLIDVNGHVASADVVRSVPPFDEAAVAAARQWEYEVSRVGGRPVSVRLTVPISFAMKLPEVARQEGIPELRQGATPAFPPGTSTRDGATVTAELTLDPDGRVAEAEVKLGEPPWTLALLQALRTWRFAPAGDWAVISFRVQADFVPGAKGAPPRVDLRLTGLRRSESMGRSEAPQTQPSAPAASPPPAPVASPAPPAPAAMPPAGPSPAPAPATFDAAGPGPGAATRSSPPTEVISAPARPAAAGAGSSAVPDVTPASGVPDLVRGRRPVVPPLARMAGVSGTVEVRFAVDAAGRASVLAVEGPDLLKAAAEQAVGTWVFRRVTAERMQLVAVFSYSGNTASAAVRPQE